MYECSCSLGTMLEHFVIAGSDGFHLVRLYLRVVKRGTPLRSKLEDGEMPDVLGYFLDCLYSRSPSANDCHPLVREINGGMRPPRGVKGLSL